MYQLPPDQAPNQCRIPKARKRVKFLAPPNSTSAYPPDCFPLFLSIDTNIGLNSITTVPTVPNSCANKITSQYRFPVHLYSLEYKGCTNSGRLQFVRWHLIRRSNPSGGEIFCTRPDRPWGRPNLLHNGYRVFPGGKAAGTWRWPPTLSSAEVKERVELYLYSTSGPSRPVLVYTVPLPLLWRLMLVATRQESAATVQSVQTSVYGQDDPAFDSRHKPDTFLFSETFKPSLLPTRPVIQSLPVVLSPPPPGIKRLGGVNLTTHLNLVARGSEWVELYLYSPYTPSRCGQRVRAAF
jgi:hypothetical protein